VIFALNARESQGFRALRGAEPVRLVTKQKGRTIRHDPWVQYEGSTM